MDMDKMTKFQMTYNITVVRIINLLPKHESLLGSVLLSAEFVEQVMMILSMKTDQVKTDKQYHHAVNIQDISKDIISYAKPSTACFEIGVTPSLKVFKKSIISKNYDDYSDYVMGILEIGIKGLRFDRQIDDLVPEDKKDKICSRYMFGHVLYSVKEKMLYMSVVWLSLDEENTILAMPPELM